MIGTQLGPYVLVEEIATGGMAAIFRAYDPNVDRFVALKVLHRSIAGDPRSMERFQREAKLVTRLEHPHLLPIYDYSATHDPPYIVMRYLEGCTLSDVLGKEKLPLGEISFMLRQIASALDYAHRQGVVHRDIKPSNILIDQDGNAFITDFGIARMMGMADGVTITHPGFAIGTPGYMAPEQSAKYDKVNHLADIYSLGVLLFRLLSGRLPYLGDTIIEIMSQHANAPIPELADSDSSHADELSAIIAKAMAKEPDERYQSASELSDEVSALVASVTAVTPITLQNVAREEIERIHQAREARQDEIDAIIEKFSRQYGQGARQANGDAINAGYSNTSVIDLATLENSLESTQETRPGRRLLISLAIVVAVILTAGILLSVQNQPDSNIVDSPTPFSDLPGLSFQSTALLQLSQAAPAVQVLRDLTIRSGPGSQYPEVGLLKTSDQVDIIGISRDGAWFLIALDDEQYGWLTTSSSLVALSGNLTVVPVAAAPTDTPSKTPTPTATLSPTSTSTRTTTPSRTPSRTPSSTPTVTATLTPATPFVTMLRDMIVRSGPGSQYGEVAMLRAGSDMNISGVSDDGAWFLIELEDGQRGWVTTSSSLVTSAGDLMVVPVAVAPTDTPTKTLTPTLIPTLTPTLTATATPSRIPSATATTTPSPTLTPTRTPSQTATTPPTSTLTPTRTPIPTSTSTATRRPRW